MKIEFPPDVDKTASGGNFIFLEDKYEIPNGESMNKRFFRLKPSGFSSFPFSFLCLSYNLFKEHLKANAIKLDIWSFTNH